MSDSPAIEYTRLEVRAYLPGGWRLADPDRPGRWDARKSCWTIPVLDTSEVTWDLRVTAKEARGERLEALQRAIDRLYREALG